MKDHKSEIKNYSNYLKIQNYAGSSRQSYVVSLKSFLNFCVENSISDITQDEIKHYLLYRHDQGCSWSTINIIYSAVKIYFTSILGHEWDFKILPRPRHEKRLPSLLSKEEVQKIIEHATMFKHQVIITLLYATGIRISELHNLRMADIHGDRLQIHIKLGKGGKDRYVEMPKCVLELLRSYYIRCRPVDYLFNGQVPGRPISQNAVSKAIQNAKHRANVLKHASAHTFRHCYATHHLEAGTNIVYLKKQMGHNDLKTTAQYIHLAQSYRQAVVHPIEQLNISYFKQNRPSVNYLETMANTTSASIRPPSTR